MLSTAWKNPVAENTYVYRILVVDDNEASAKTMGWMMELLGHEVQLAHDGQEALAAARSFVPDVVLMDIGLPGMDGYEVCRMLRQESVLERTVFIAQTGWGEQEHRERSRSAGFAHHLVKPVELSTVQQLLDKLDTSRQYELASTATH